MKEELERVVSEAQLRPGLLVETRGCRTCDGVHRHILLGRDTDPRPCAICLRSPCGWRIPRSIHPGDPYICTSSKIAAGHLYIVNPFAENSTTQKAKRPREVTRG